MVLHLELINCTLMIKELSTHIGIGDALAMGIQAPAGTCKLMNIAI